MLPRPQPDLRACAPAEDEEQLALRLARDLRETVGRERETARRLAEYLGARATAQPRTATTSR